MKTPEEKTRDKFLESLMGYASLTARVFDQLKRERLFPPQDLKATSPAWEHLKICFDDWQSELEKTAAKDKAEAEMRDLT